MNDASPWTPTHHEEADQEQVPVAQAERATKAAAKPDKEKDGPALILTIPPNMIAGLWSLSEALEKNTETMRELIDELRAARQSIKQK